MQRKDLARLTGTTPGASEALAWTKDGREIVAPGLADGDRKRPAELPKDWQAVGIAWPVAHVTDGAEIFCQGGPPPPTSLELQAFDGEK